MHVGEVSIPRDDKLGSLGKQSADHDFAIATQLGRTAGLPPQSHTVSYKLEKKKLLDVFDASIRVPGNQPVARHLCCAAEHYAHIRSACSQHQHASGIRTGELAIVGDLSF